MGAGPAVEAAPVVVVEEAVVVLACAGIVLVLVLVNSGDTWQGVQG